MGTRNPPIRVPFRSRTSHSSDEIQSAESHSEERGGQELEATGRPRGTTRRVRGSLCASKRENACTEGPVEFSSRTGDTRGQSHTVRANVRGNHRSKESATGQSEEAECGTGTVERDSGTVHGEREQATGTIQRVCRGEEAKGDVQEQDRARG